MVEEGEICDDLWFRWSSGWVHWADCRVWCVTCDQEAKCKTRRNARCPVPGACTWRPAAARDGTILQFSSLVIIFPGRELFKLSFFTGFSSRYFCLIPFCGSVTHTHRLISWLSSRSILLWTLWSLEAHTWSRCHHITCHTPGSDQDSITPVTALMTRSPLQSNGNLTRSASKKSNPPCYFPFQCSGLWQFWHTSWCDWYFKDGSEEKPQALNVSH